LTGIKPIHLALEKNNMQGMTKRLVFAMIVLIFSALGAKGIKAATGNLPPILAQAESLWSLRGQPAQARRCLSAYTEAASSMPGDGAVWVRLARIRCLVAMYIEKDATQRDALLKAGMDAAHHALDRSPSFQVEFSKSKSEKKAAKTTGKEAIDALYWYGVNLGIWASDKSIFTRLANKSTLEAINQRVLDLDEAYFFAAPHRFFGVLPTKVPGGNLAESKRHFERALALAPNCFISRTLYAENYAVKAKDKTLFLAQLDYVLNTSSDLVPELAPENRYEKEKARALKARVGEFFP
jgi:hypothetical protein